MNSTEELTLEMAVTEYFGVKRFVVLLVGKFLFSYGSLKQGDQGNYFISYELNNKLKKHNLHNNLVLTLILLMWRIW
jgi:hypothetical protein